MNDEHNIEQIHQYLSGQMDDTSRKDFEQAMSQDEALRQDVLAEEQLLQAIESALDRASSSASGSARHRAPLGPGSDTHEVA